ncbi:MAG: cytochrome c oxidase subunit 3 [Candidatus Marinimicrobia bacterium]|nr:cytochrome c oxidase subunit 3 [Candidatus Neomarinimicrobiota bacterium]
MTFHPPEATLRTSMGLPSGRLAIWWLLVSEIVIFGGLLGTYLILRVVNPQWGAEAEHTNLYAGGLNTLVLLTSSLAMVMGHAAAEKGNGKLAAKYLSYTVLCGVLFLVIKLAWEYIPEINLGYTPLKSVFWTFYYLATGLHALHVIAGMVTMLILLPAVRRNVNLQRVEYVGIYWHFVDAVWIFLFPLFYIAS